MGWDEWMRLLDWAQLGCGGLLGVFCLLALGTGMLEERGGRRPDGVRRGRLYAKGLALFSLFLMVSATKDLFVSARWLELALIVFEFACLGGYGWLLVAANRVRSEPGGATGLSTES